VCALGGHIEGRFRACVRLHVDSGAEESVAGICDEEAGRGLEIR